MYQEFIQIMENAFGDFQIGNSGLDFSLFGFDLIYTIVCALILFLPLAIIIRIIRRVCN